MAIGPAVNEIPPEALILEETAAKYALVPSDSRADALVREALERLFALGIDREGAKDLLRWCLYAASPKPAVRREKRKSPGNAPTLKALSVAALLS
jgi:hypothetical protein